MTKIPTPDCARIRQRLGLSQSQFARLLGVGIRAVQNWEQGVRAPGGAAVTLLQIVERNPDVLRH